MVKARTAWEFPFYGQGDAGYYEWFEMWVWFVEPVPPAQRKRVLADAPRLCTADAQWPHPTLLWASTGDQWIQQHLVDEYGTKAAQKKMAKATAHHEAVLEGDDDDGDDDYLDDLIASGGETAKFNAAIERWLIALHARTPILFAARRQDLEAGGTRLGKWHGWSVDAYPTRVQGALAEATQKKLAKNDLRNTPIRLVLEYVKADKVVAPTPPPPSKACEAAKRAVLAHDATKTAKAIAKGLASPFEYVTVLGALYERLLMWGLEFDDRWCRIAYTLGKGAFADGAFVDHMKLCEATGDYMIDAAAASLYYVALAGAHSRGDRALFATLANKLRTRPAKQTAHPRLIYGKLGALGTPIDKLAAKLEKFDADGYDSAAMTRFEAGDYAGALELAERAAAFGKPSWRLVSNAIAIAVHAHPKKFPPALLARWQKRAPSKGTHAGYWENVACAQVRLGRHDAAIESLRRAIEFGFDRDQIAKDAVLAPLRKLPDYKALMALST